MRQILLVPTLLALAACGGQSAGDKASTHDSGHASTVASVPTSAASTVAGAESHSFDTGITIADFKQQLKTVSLDDFKGREPGTEGGQRTVDYLVQRFKAMGLEPGNHGEWLQEVPAVSVDRTNYDIPLKVHAGDKELALSYPNDYVGVTLQQQPKVSLKDSEIVFVGYGVNAPERNWNDYGDIDVKGKTVIMLVNDPGWGNQDPELFDGKTMTYYGRWTYKYEEAARQGAAAAFVVHETGGAGYPWTVVENGWSGPQYALPLEDSSPRTLPVAGWISTDAARKVFSAAGLDFDQLKAASDQRGFEPVALDATASLDIESSIEHTKSYNVLALKRGSTRPDEVIVYTAHWDHLGVDESLEGDQIYNGAIDNGTGIAALLEVGAAFAGQQPPPERSVLFAAVTLEESGLLGAAWYVSHPSFPLDHTVANINMDALPVIGPAHDMVVVGLGNSELDDYLAKAVAAQDRSLTPDPHPEAGHYFRSDHFNFAKAGVPALYASGGTDLLEGGKDAGDAAELDYVQHRYHQPADNFDPDWDFRGVVKDVQALYQVGKQLASETSYPKWAEGSPFRAKRQAMLEQAETDSN